MLAPAPSHPGPTILAGFRESCHAKSRNSQKSIGWRLRRVPCCYLHHRAASCGAPNILNPVPPSMFRPLDRLHFQRGPLTKLIQMYTITHRPAGARRLKTDSAPAGGKTIESLLPMLSLDRKTPYHERLRSVNTESRFSALIQRLASNELFANDCGELVCEKPIHPKFFVQEPMNL